MNQIISFVNHNRLLNIIYNRKFKEYSDFSKIYYLSKKPQEIKLITKSIQRTAHLFELGNPKSLSAWIVAHGYAMTGDQILKKFDKLDLENNYFLAPEALSSFYWKSNEGDVPVASWMTSRFRLDEIADYSTYLDGGFSMLKGRSKKHLFGFSQGGTTMWRFINQCKPKFSYFINWAGDIPADSVYDLEYLKDKVLYYIYGSNDQYISNQRIISLKERASQLGINVTFISFDGNHKVDRSFLKTLFNKLKLEQHGL